MNKIKWITICLLVYSAILLDLDNLAFYTPIGRIVIFDVFIIIFILINMLKLKYIRDNRLLNIFFLVMLFLIFYQAISGFYLLQTIDEVSYSNTASVIFKYLMYLIAMFFMTNHIIANKLINQYKNIWFYSSVVVSIVGLFQILAINDIPIFRDLFLWGNIRGGGHRIAATFRWQGVFIFYLSIIIPLMIGTMLDNEKVIFKKKYLNLLIMILLLISGFYSGSRSFLLIIASSLLLVVLNPLVKNGIRLSISKIFFLLLSIIPVYYIINSFVLSSLAVRRVLGLEGAVGVTSGVSPRERIIRSGMEAFETSPFLGVGSGNFNEIVGDASHNSYLEILVENGIFGIMIFTIIFVLLIYICIVNVMKAFKERKTHALSVSLIILNILIYQLTAAAIQYRILWVILPLIFANYYKYSNYETPKI
ncbi:O-Antigen ligase [Pelagirhabdus alkalitolerans]|uniref:O-Antigen ligase n=1 Tax=Pelagirhabdus alkalitolerans TaxID=1612202 RepID=A0A1G6GGE8_9BACI|nr:O-antigen ligase family protein [Pelagirhabdus alkalitolerans]SDB81081.1 O-Antigen ligase [Pelagirhabdus alkalitolerans]